MDPKDQKIQELEAKVRELSDNLSGQRRTHTEELKAKDDELAAAKSEIEQRDQARAAELDAHRTKRIESIAKGDSAIAEKIRAEYQNLAIDDSTAEGIEQRALKAFQLATAVSPDPLAASVHTETSPSMQPAAGEKLSAEGTAVYQQLFNKAPPTEGGQSNS